jgi:3',5'-cyclic AMP phosphodiesterase CpdA
MVRIACNVLFALGLTAAVAPAPARAQAWKFGVMADSQWAVKDDGKNPNSVAAVIIEQINRQFIAGGVKFVVQVGDLSDNGSVPATATRAVFAQSLYNAGVGFFPIRGNHDGSQAAANEFRRVFPQTRNGTHNTTPADAVKALDGYDPAPANTGAPFTLGSDFSSPALAGGSSGLDGLSYAFTHNNARFVLLDQFTRTDGTGSGSANVNNNNIADQLDWIGSALKGKPAGGHAFVFGHKNLIGQNHNDNLLGANPAQNPALRNAFLATLAANGVRYYISGHDHIYHRSLVASPDGATRLMQLMCASDSTKFYIPAVPSPDARYNNPPREVPVTQERNTIGYCIFTVDGPRVTVEYHSAAVNPRLSSSQYIITSSPALAFGLRETFGYGLDGKQFLVPQGESYSVVQDTYRRTAARILDGINPGTLADGSGRPLTKAVDIAWTALPSASALASDILTVWGMGMRPGVAETDVYALSMSYDETRLPSLKPGDGRFGLATRDAGGKWVAAVDGNFGGTKRFVMGPWRAGYGLGTYGVDPKTRTAWAVINHEGEFAVSGGIR